MNDSNCPVCRAFRRSEELMHQATLLQGDRVATFGIANETKVMELAAHYLGWAVTAAQTMGHDNDCPKLADIQRKNAAYVAGVQRQAAQMADDSPLPGENIKKRRGDA